MSKTYNKKQTEAFSVTDPLSLFTGNGNVVLSNINAKNYTDLTYFGVLFDYNSENINYGHTTINTDLSLKSAANASGGFYNLLGITKNWQLRANNTAKAWTINVTAKSIAPVAATAISSIGALEFGKFNTQEMFRANITATVSNSFKGASDDSYALATAIYVDSATVFAGNWRGNLTVKSTSSIGTAFAYGINAGNVYITTVSGKMAATATANSSAHEAMAYLFNAGEVAIGKIANKLTASATAGKTKQDSGAYAESSVFYLSNNFIADAIASTVASDATATYGSAFSVTVQAGDIYVGNVSSAISATAKGGIIASATVFATPQPENHTPAEGDEKTSTYTISINQITAAITATATGVNKEAQANANVFNSSEININKKLSGSLSATAKAAKSAAAATLFAQQDITINADIASNVIANATSTAANANASAITSIKGSIAIADIKGTVSANAVGNKPSNTGTETTASAIIAEKSIKIGHISGSISATTKTTQYDAVRSFAVFSNTGDITTGNISGKISAAANARGSFAEAYAIRSDAGVIVTRDISGSISVTASGNIRENSNGTAFAVALSAKKAVITDDISGNLSATATSGFCKATATVVSAETGFTVNDITAGIETCDISGKITATATSEYWAEATGFLSTGSNIVTGDINNSITITSKATSTDIGYAATAYAFDAKLGKVDLGAITKPITVSASNMGAPDLLTGELGCIALCIDAYALTLNDEISGKISVTSNSKNYTEDCFACGFRANTIYIGNGFSLNQLNVTASGDAIGIRATNEIITDPGTVINGKYTVKSTGHAAIGIRANMVVDTQYYAGTISADISVSGKNIAAGLYITHAVLNISEAKITVSTTNKDGDAYAIISAGDDMLEVAATETTEATTVEVADFVEVSGKSTITGKIDLGEGSNDTVRIHSGSKVTGAFENVENVELVLDDSDFKNALWQNVDGSDKVDLAIDLAYGMTGTFALCSRKSASTNWSELDNDGKIQLNIDGVEFKNLDINNGVAADDFYQYKIVKKGNTISLAVTTI